MAVPHDMTLFKSPYSHSNERRVWTPQSEHWIWAPSSQRGRVQLQKQKQDSQGGANAGSYMTSLVDSMSYWVAPRKRHLSLSADIINSHSLVSQREGTPHSYILPCKLPILLSRLLCVPHTPSQRLIGVGVQVSACVLQLWLQLQMWFFLMNAK